MQQRKLGSSNLKFPLLDLAAWDCEGATKFGFKIDKGKQAGLDSRPEHIKEVAEASLKRLGRGKAAHLTSLSA